MGERERTDLIGQLRSLPQRGEEVWQAGLAQMPIWVGERLEESERPWVGVCVSLTSQALNMTEPAMPDEAGFELVLRALLGGMMGSGMRGYLPGTLRVSDPELAAYLRAALRETPVRVEQGDDDALRQVMNFMQEGTEAAMTPGALDGDGVDVERMRAFAEAARRFYAAAPWRHLNDHDLIEIESPAVPEAIRFVSVMGSGGMQHGFGFFPSRRVYERLYESPGDPGVLMKHGTVWSVTFGPIQELPLDDADLFSDHGLPVAADRAYPVALGIGKRGVTRPDAVMLNVFEGLLLAMAQSTEDDFDAGRWRRAVKTFDGDVEFVLSIPSLLEAMQGSGAAATANPLNRAASMRKLEREMRRLLAVAQESGITSAEEMNAFMQQRLAEAPAAPSAPQAPRTPAEEAQDLVYEAMDAVGRRQVQLIRRAISIDPDCADAYNLLGDRTGDPRESEPLYRRAMEAARRSLDPELFRSAAGHFWGVMETRPYMRAMYGLAESLDRQDRFGEAIEQYQEMLRLNPNDNQGARYSLAPALYRADRIEECLRLLEQYDEPSAATLYLRALVLFRMQGDSPAAREAASRAIGGNRHMVKYLTGRAELPPAGPPTYSPGSDDEAVTFAYELIDLWENMPGALAWLERQKPAKAKGKPRSAASGKGKGKGKKRG